MPTPARFSWDQYLAVAEELAKNTDEATLRTAINRAYYYTLHLARQRLATNGFHFDPSVGSHIQVWDPFTSNPDAQIKAIGTLGTTLKGKRVHADYKDAPYVRIQDDVKTVMATAKQFAAKLAQLPSHLPRNVPR